MRGLGKGVSGKPYPRMCNARRPRLEPGTFRSQAVRLYRLHQACPSGSDVNYIVYLCFKHGDLEQFSLEINIDRAALSCQ